MESKFRRRCVDGSSLAHRVETDAMIVMKKRAWYDNPEGMIGL